MSHGQYMRFTFHCKKQKPEKRQGKKIAIIGSGPAGLGAAGYLACKGYYITIFERLPYPGGLMVFSIPELRIPKKRVLLGTHELEDIFGVEFKLKTKVVANGDFKILGDDLSEKTESLEHIIDEYDATLITTGIWISRKLPAEGVDKEGVYFALDFLFKNRLYDLGLISADKRVKLGNKVAVVGAGLVAVDAALEARSLGKEVLLLSIEKMHEAPAGGYEINRLLEIGVKHIERVIIKKVLGENRIQAVEIVDVNAEISNGIIKKLQPIPGTERVIEVDTLITAIGQRPSPPMNKEVLGIKLERWGGITVNDKFMTTREKVFAAGDVAMGPTKVGRALQSGMFAAKYIDMYLNNLL